MGKKKNHRAPVPKNAKTAHRKSTHTPQNLSKPPPKKSKNSHQKQHQQKATPIVPYDSSSKILLVGEGDFSFSVSLLTHHLSPVENSFDGDNDGDELNIDEGGVYDGLGSCNPIGGGGEGGDVNLIATSYDTEVALLEKYPQAAEKVKLLRERGVAVLHGVDITKFDKLPKVLRKRKGGFDAVGFMFPHVGGLSTDVERQVKSNQELLLGFFKSTKSLLTSTGTAVVTLFEGTPYDLWDIKSLAKSAGFRTRRSFVFQSSVYPDYKHARTLGNVEGAGGAWKGEERKARTYVFELVEDKGYTGEKTGANAVEVKRVKKTTKRERRWGDASDDDDDDDT